MTRAAAFAPVAAAFLLLGGCAAIHLNDHAFGARPGDPAAAEPGMADEDPPSHAARLARLLHLPKDRPFGPKGAVYGPYGAVVPGRRGAPPCKFGGARCPPWERAWPAQSGVGAGDRVTANGSVIRAKTAAPAS